MFLPRISHIGQPGLHRSPVLKKQKSEQGCWENICKSQRCSVVKTLLSKHKCSVPTIVKKKAKMQCPIWHLKNAREELEMAQWLRTRYSCRGNLCSFIVPTRQLTAITPLPGDLVPSSGLYTHNVCIWIYMYVGIIHTHIHTHDMHIFLFFFLTTHRSRTQYYIQYK